MTDKPGIQPDHYAAIYTLFQASISRFDCGKHCAPHNDGEPVCCTTDHAVPVMQKAEWKLLKSRTKMWRRYKPNDAAGRKIVKELATSCVAVNCRGARHCERDNRALACRAFPFFPYLTREGDFIGLSYYSDFEDRCWVISNLGIVEREYVTEFVAAYELLFKADPEEFEVYKEHSANMRRLFSRRRQDIPLIGRNGGYLKVLPYGAGIEAARVEEFPQFEPYKDAPQTNEEMTAATPVSGRVMGDCSPSIAD